MKCSLPRCNKTVPPTSRSYCCRAHGVIGQINKVVEHDAKKVGRKVSLCASEGCNRIFREQEGIDKCYACRTNKGDTCKRDGCGKKIPKGRKSTALFCCDACYIIQRGINRAKKELAKTQKKKGPVPCDAKGCGEMYVKTSNAQKFCPKCRKAGGSYDPETGKFVFNKSRGVKHDLPFTSPGKMHSDHRETVCRQGGKLCSSYSACTDPQPVEGKNSWQIVMEYEENGGANCYHLEDTPDRVSYGHSFGTCSDNHAC